MNSAVRPLQALVHAVREGDQITCCRVGYVADMPWSDCWTEITCPGCQTAVMRSLLGDMLTEESSA